MPSNLCESIDSCDISDSSDSCESSDSSDSSYSSVSSDNSDSSDSGDRKRFSHFFFLQYFLLKPTKVSTQIVMKLKYSNCDETQKLKL